MNVYVTNARHFCGTHVYRVVDLGGELAPSLIDIDSNMPDAELFAVCLRAMAVRWSSSGGVPFFEASMARRGAVRRMACGRVSVAGEGWAVMFSNEEIDRVEKEHINANRWEEATDMMRPISVYRPGGA